MSEINILRSSDVLLWHHIPSESLPPKKSGKTGNFSIYRALEERVSNESESVNDCEGSKGADVSPRGALRNWGLRLEEMHSSRSKRGKGKRFAIGKLGILCRQLDTMATPSNEIGTISDDRQIRQLIQDARKMKNRNPQKAMDTLEEAFAKSPNDVKVLMEIGNMALFLEKPKKARKFFLRAQELYPKKVEPIGGIAKVLRFEEKFDEAIALLDKALEIDPESKYLLFIRKDVEKKRIKASKH